MAKKIIDKKSLKKETKRINPKTVALAKALKSFKKK